MSPSTGYHSKSPATKISGRSPKSDSSSVLISTIQSNCSVFSAIGCPSLSGYSTCSCGKFSCNMLIRFISRQPSLDCKSNMACSGNPSEWATGNLVPTLRVGMQGGRSSVMIVALFRKISPPARNRTFMRQLGDIIFVNSRRTVQKPGKLPIPFCRTLVGNPVCSVSFAFGWSSHSGYPGTGSGSLFRGLLMRCIPQVSAPAG